jgi:hypothetical protein
VLLHCFSGCSWQEIVAALGIRMGDLMGNAAPHHPASVAPTQTFALAPGPRRARLTPGEEAGREILVDLWRCPVEVRVSPDLAHLVITPSNRVPARLMAVAMDHEAVIVAALKVIDGVLICDQPGGLTESYPRRARSGRRPMDGVRR